MTHALKCWPDYFRPLALGLKTFEWRKNDRAYKVGDILVLREYDPDRDFYSGDSVTRRVTFVMGDAFEMPTGYVVLGLGQP